MIVLKRSNHVIMLDNREHTDGQEKAPESQKPGISSTLSKWMKKARNVVLAGIMPILASCSADTRNIQPVPAATEAVIDNNSNAENADTPGIRPGLMGDNIVSLAGDYPGQLYLEAQVYYQNHDEAKKDPDEVLQFSSVNGSYNFEGAANGKVKKFYVKAAHDSDMMEDIPIVKDENLAKQVEGILGSDRFPPDGVASNW